MVKETPFVLGMIDLIYFKSKRIDLEAVIKIKLVVLGH